jgi:hypothetical protein
MALKQVVPIRAWLISLQGNDAQGKIIFFSRYLYRFDDNRIHPADVDALTNSAIEHMVLRSCCVIAINPLSHVTIDELPETVRAPMAARAVELGLLDMELALANGWIPKPPEEEGVMDA